MSCAKVCFAYEPEHMGSDAAASDAGDAPATPPVPSLQPWAELAPPPPEMSRMGTPALGTGVAGVASKGSEALLELAQCAAAEATATVASRARRMTSRETGLGDIQRLTIPVREVCPRRRSVNRQPLLSGRLKMFAMTTTASKFATKDGVRRFAARLLRQAGGRRAVKTRQSKPTSRCLDG